MAPTWVRRGWMAASLFWFSLGFAGVAAAQIITIRTVPLAQGDQFDIFPSHNVGMGGASIALADTLLDPFRNPAKGARVAAGRFFGTPTFYSVSGDAGGGRTLPVAAFARRGLWFGALSLALQEVDASRPPAPGFGVTVDVVGPPPPPPPDLGPSQRSHGNGYAFASVGRVLPHAVSLGGSLFWAGLHAVDGVDLLYAGSERVKQYGHAVDIRAGLLKEWTGNRSLEAVVVHSRYGMTHDVTYLDFFWDPNTQQTGRRGRMERNLDFTNLWGLHLEYERPSAAPGWRVGWLLTVNQMTHPKIPNYEIMSIPRDPGYSSAFNLGMGLSRRDGPAQFAVDVIYEPIWSYTWADAAAPVETISGDTIPAGGKTIENRFRFSNAVLRMGVSRDLDFGGVAKALGLQLGLVARAISYRLDQYDNVQAFGRTQRERWLEWSPTWGLSLRFPELEIRYRGRVTNGTGRPGVTSCRNCFAVADAVVAGGGILAAPSGPLTLDEVKLASHQVSVSLPLR
jgi:hypothetical protein